MSLDDHRMKRMKQIKETAEYAEYAEKDYHQMNQMNQMAGTMCYFLPTDFTNITKFVFCVILRLLLFVYPYLVHLVHLVTILKLSSCSSCSPLATPSPCPMFHTPFLYLHRWKVRGVGLDGEISKQPVMTQ